MPKAVPLKSLAPVLAVVIIFAVFLVAEYWVLPARRAAQQAPAPPASAPPEVATPVSTAAAPPEPTALPAVALPAAGTPATVEPSTVWSTYHGDTSLNGYVLMPVPARPTVRWQTLLEGAIHQAPVSDANGIYVASSTGRITALNFAGQERWHVDLMRSDAPDKPERVDAPMTCFRDTLLVSSIGGRVRALDAGSGAIRWAYTLGGEVLGAAMPYADADTTQSVRVYVIQRDNGALHCIDFASGQSLGVGEAISRCDGSPSLLDGLLVYGSCDFALHVHDAATGSLLKNIRLCEDCQVAGGVARVGDYAYTGSRAGYFYCADVRSGGIVWTNQDCTGEIFTTPAVAPETVVFGGEDGTVYGLDRATGRTRWRYAGGGVPTSAVIAGSHVLVGVDGALHVLALADGALVWTHEVSDGIAAPAVINDMIILGSEDGTVVALGNEAG